jgi:mannose/fructose/N-acetylgalactosamine-specific phosphotransferase system component IIC
VQEKAPAAAPAQPAAGSHTPSLRAAHSVRHMVVHNLSRHQSGAVSDTHYHSSFLVTLLILVVNATVAVVDMSIIDIMSTYNPHCVAVGMARGSTRTAQPSTTPT